MRGLRDRLLRVVWLMVVPLLVIKGAFAFIAEVEEISGDRYFPEVIERLKEAKESVEVMMYLVGPEPRGAESKVGELVQELLGAHKRGLRVRVILDRTIREERNQWCYELLKKEGIEVFYDREDKLLHNKVVIVDEEWVAVGSANWTESGLERNYESGVLIKSKEIAYELLKQMEAIRQEAGDFSGAEYVGSVAVSWSFLEKDSLCGRMLARQDENAFDLYLLLLRDFTGNPEGKLILDYDGIADELGLSGRMGRTAYRRHLMRVLRRLERNYGLIHFEPKYAKEATVTLLSYEDAHKPYAQPSEWYFRVPRTFWDYGWDKRLSFKAKFCYLVNLAYESISNDKPWWFASREGLAERFNLSEWSISKGMEELRRQNIIDVRYPSYEGVEEGKRLAKSYKVLGLYDPAGLEIIWDRLRVKYGEGLLREARGFARVVFKENDPAAVEEMLKALQEDRERFRRAVAIVAQKNVDNPKRNFEYLMGVWRRMEQE